MRKVIFHPTMFTVLLIICLLGEIAALVFLTRVPWYIRVGVPLQILAFYSIGLGMIVRSETIKDVLVLSEDMTSHNLHRFIRGNMLFLSLFFALFAVSVSPNRKRGGSTPLGCFSGVVLMVVTPFVFLYPVFHVVVIMPSAYLCYVAASALVERVQYSADDVGFSVSSVEMVRKFRVSELVVSNPVAAKSFIIGIPAAFLSLGMKLIALFHNT